MTIVAGLGVRAKTALQEEASEFVIRESSNGNETLSLIHVDDLIQVATSKRDDMGNVTIEKHMITKNIETFSHYRYDWLDNYKILWWIITGIGFMTVLLSSFLSPLVFLLNIGILLFFVGLFLTIMQIADPEYIVFETSSGSHRFLVYRIGSNRPLTNISMELIDDIMQNYLKTGKLDTSTFDERLLFSMNSPTDPTNASPTAAPTSPPPTAAPTSPPPTPAPMRLNPIHPPSIPAGPPLVNPSVMDLPITSSDFSEIPPPPPVDFSDIPPPPRVTDLESVSEEDKNQLLDELK